MKTSRASTSIEVIPYNIPFSVAASQSRRHRPKSYTRPVFPTHDAKWLTSVGRAQPPLGVLFYELESLKTWPVVSCSFFILFSIQLFLYSITCGAGQRSSLDALLRNPSGTATGNITAQTCAQPLPTKTCISSTRQWVPGSWLSGFLRCHSLNLFAISPFCCGRPNSQDPYVNNHPFSRPDDGHSPPADAQNCDG